MALVVPLAGTPEAAGEEVVGLKLREGTRALASPAAQDAGDGELRVVIEDALRDTAEVSPDMQKRPSVDRFKTGH